MRIAISIDGQFIPMTGIQHSVDSLIHHLVLDPSNTGGDNEVWAFASDLPDENAVEEYARAHPGTFEWRNLPGAKFDTKNEFASTLVPERFRRDHPWLAAKIHEQERKILHKQNKGPHERLQSYDVFHWPEPVAFTFADYKAKAVATLHDIATRKFGSTYSAAHSAVWERYYHFAASRCAHTVAVSESTKQDYMEAFEMSSDRITVTPLAARASAKRMEDGPERRALLEEWELHRGDTPFVLYAGTLEPRKNLPKLIKAFSNIVRQDPTLPHKLVLAGGNWNRLDIEMRLLAIEYGITGRVITTGYVSNAQLNALMSACDAFAYVSLYEGFGMPPLEAMVCGAPVIASNTSSLPEVVGDAGIQVDPKNTEEIAAALHLLMTDRAENARRRALSFARAQTFTWERTARLTMEAYEKAAAC